MIKYTEIKIAAINSVYTKKFHKLLTQTTPIMVEQDGTAAQYNLGHLLDQMDDTYEEYNDLKQLVEKEIYYIEV